MYLTIAIGGTIAVIGLELALWLMFKRRTHGLDFPRDADVSHLRFFTLNRIRFCAVLHSAFLLAVLHLSLFYVW